MDSVSNEVKYNMHINLKYISLYMKTDITLTRSILDVYFYEWVYKYISSYVCSVTYTYYAFV